MGDICTLKHETVDEKFVNHEMRLSNHSKRIDTLEIESREYKIQIQNLCKEVENLVNTIKWGVRIVCGAFMTGLIGLFFYLAQKGLG